MKVNRGASFKGSSKDVMFKGSAKGAAKAYTDFYKNNSSGNSGTKGNSVIKGKGRHWMDKDNMEEKQKAIRRRLAKMSTYKNKTKK